MVGNSPPGRTDIVLDATIILARVPFSKGETHQNNLKTSFYDIIMQGLGQLRFRALNNIIIPLRGGPNVVVIHCADT